MKPFFSPELSNLLEQLLIQTPEYRLGAGGAQEVMEHPFFDDIDWEKLKRLEVTPPFIPNLVGGYDVSNFDGEFTKQTPVESPCHYNGMPEPSFQGFTYIAYLYYSFLINEHSG